MTGPTAARSATDDAPNIVVIEDDASIGKLLRHTLEGSGFSVTLRTNGRSGVLALEQQHVDLLVLDLGLPDVDGIELLRQLRAGGTDRPIRQVPVVILTARNDESDRVLGLELGADDYVDKPFSPRELTARIRAVLRRSVPDPDRDGGPPVRVGGLTLDPARREVRHDAAVVELTATEFELLEFLMRHRGTVCRRELLLERVWGYHATSTTRTVDVHLGQLRRKLGNAVQLTTVRGIGYRLDP